MVLIGRFFFSFVRAERVINRPGEGLFFFGSGDQGVGA